MLLLGATVFGIAAVILIIIVLLQCGDKDKDTSSVGNGNVGNGEECTPAVTDEGLKNNEEQQIDCTIDLDENAKSSSLKSDKLVVATRPRQPSPFLTRSTNEKDKSDGSHESNGHVPEVATTIKSLDQVQPCSEAKKPVASNPNEEKVKSEGSFENSGSGDGIYTKVKPVKEKEECAYSVVNIANKDTEYEVIDGKLQRKDKTPSLREEVEEDADKSEYEVVENAKKTELDPVLFAVEDSGASGIYEDVPDRKVSEPRIEKSEKDGKKNDESKDKQEGKASEVHHEEHKKKWGLTRFSLIKRGKSKKDQDIVKSEKPSHGTSPKTPERLSPGSIENLNSSAGKSENLFSAVSPRPRLDKSGLPPLPPVENLRLKVEHRRTIHEMELQGNTPNERGRTLSGSELGSTPLPSTPNSYSVPPTKIDDDDVDGLYEIPDRDVSKAKVKESSKNASKKRRQGPDLSPLLVHRAVPKPPKEKLVVTVDDVDMEANENYDTISCDIDFGKDDLSKRSDSNSSREPSYDRVKDGVVAAEPEYATVDKGESEKDVNRKSLSKSTCKEEQQIPIEEKKIEVLIRRTTISSNVSGKPMSRQTSVKEVEITEIPSSPGTPSSQGLNAGPFDSVPTPPELEDLYAKVNLEEKHAEEAMRALYATVDKEKTGKIKIYRKEDAVETREEFEDGHYTKIKDDDSELSGAPQAEGTASISSDYETLDEQKTSAMFANIRPSKHAQSNTKTAKKPKENEKTNSDYEVVTQLNKDGVTSKREKKNAPSDDYEEIVTERRNIVTNRGRNDDYLEINDISDGRKEQSTFDMKL